MEGNLQTRKTVAQWEQLGTDFHGTVDQLDTAGRSGAFSAIVLAGAYGWGSTCQVEGLPPRPLAPVALAPIICYVLRWLQDSGASDIAVCAGAFSRKLRTAIGDDFRGSRLSYHTDRMPRGSAGCIRDAAVATREDLIVVAEATIVPGADLPQLVREHRRVGAAMSVVAYEGTPQGALDPRPTGILLLDRRVLGLIRAFGYHDIKENLIPELHDAGEHVTMLTIEEPCPQVVTVESYLAVNQWLVQRLTSRHGLPPEWSSWTRRDDAIVHPTAEIAADAMLIGSVLIGRQARVLERATIVGPTVIGEDVVVGRDVLVSRSVVGKGSLVADSAVLHGSVLAEGSRVEEASTLHEVVPSAHKLTSTRPRRTSSGEDRTPYAVSDVPVPSIA